MTPDETEYLAALEAYHAALARLSEARKRVPDLLALRKKEQIRASGMRQAKQNKRRWLEPWPKWLQDCDGRLRGQIIRYALWGEHRPGHGITVDDVRAKGRDYWRQLRPLGAKSLARLDALVRHW